MIPKIYHVYPNCDSIKPRSHCPGFQPRRRYGVDTGAYRGAGKHRFKSGYTVLNQCSPGSGPGGFIFFKTTVTHRAAKQRRLIPGHRRSSSGINRISTVRPPGKTIVNRHELCPRWPRCVTEESRCSPDSFRSNYGLAR